MAPVALAQPAHPANGNEPSTSLRTPQDTDWPKKSSLYLFRTDGLSCSREIITGNGTLQLAYPSTQQQLLVWKNRPRGVMVFKKLGDELLPEFLDAVRYLGQTEGLHVLVEPPVFQRHFAHRDDMPYVYTWRPEELKRLSEWTDFVVCLGGDGVILHAASVFKQAGSMPPIISFNLGSLGFLTNHLYQDFKEDIREVIYGTTKLSTCQSVDSFEANEDGGNKLGVMVTLRMRLHCEIWRKGHKRPEDVYEVLNEVVMDRGPNAFLTNIEVYEKGRFVTRVQADGIMLATPTGSTAYSVAAGGSMVHPNVPAILMTPICPHSLSFRPIMLPDYADIELRVPVVQENARCTAWVCFDGRMRQELHRGDHIRVKMSANPVPTINKADLTSDWFGSLERCLSWSSRMEQKPLGYTGGMGEDEPASSAGGPGERSMGSTSAPTAAHHAAAAPVVRTAA